MKSKVLLTLLASLPMIVFAQNNSQALQKSRSMHQQMNTQNQKRASERATSNQQWRMQNMMSKSLNKSIIAETKLEKEEKNKKKLEEKAEELNIDLKTKHEELVTLENKQKNLNDPEIQANIEKLKKKFLK